eukprot:TRINITY_DN2560_c0_g1_i2.p1 TRINITY_DN2560_c0_g1~~TRINITY_DN2560_c0_g1_i2.p1  ORF type:complete len:167 (-),score=4.49 TRINITY_DN2560_c0_g1_i2:122-622(-)
MVLIDARTEIPTLLNNSRTFELAQFLSDNFPKLKVPEFVHPFSWEYRSEVKFRILVETIHAIHILEDMKSSINWPMAIISTDLKTHLEIEKFLQGKQEVSFMNFNPFKSENCVEHDCDMIAELSTSAEDVVLWLVQHLNTEWDGTMHIPDGMCVKKPTIILFDPAE